jgi:hypothetical protein
MPSDDKLPDGSLFFTREGHRRPVIGTAATKPLRGLLRSRGDIYEMAQKVIKLQLSLFYAAQDAANKMDTSRVFMGCDIGKLYETNEADSEVLTKTISESISGSGPDAQRVWTWEKSLMPFGAWDWEPLPMSRRRDKLRFENEAEYATDIDEW